MDLRDSLSTTHGDWTQNELSRQRDRVSELITSDQHPHLHDFVGVLYQGGIQFVPGEGIERCDAYDLVVIHNYPYHRNGWQAPALAKQSYRMCNRLLRIYVMMTVGCNDGQARAFIAFILRVLQMVVVVDSNVDPSNRSAQNSRVTYVKNTNGYVTQVTEQIETDPFAFPVIKEQHYMLYCQCACPLLDSVQFDMFVTAATTKPKRGQELVLDIPYPTSMITDVRTVVSDWALQRLDLMRRPVDQVDIEELLADPLWPASDHCSWIGTFDDLMGIYPFPPRSRVYETSRKSNLTTQLKFSPVHMFELDPLSPVATVTETSPGPCFTGRARTSFNWPGYRSKIQECEDALARLAIFEIDPDEPLTIDANCERYARSWIGRFGTASGERIALARRYATVLARQFSVGDRLLLLWIMIGSPECSRPYFSFNADGEVSVDGAALLRDMARCHEGHVPRLAPLIAFYVSFVAEPGYPFTRGLVLSGAEGLGKTLVNERVICAPFHPSCVSTWNSAIGYNQQALSTIIFRIDDFGADAKSRQSKTAQVQNLNELIKVVTTPEKIGSNKFGGLVKRGYVPIVAATTNIDVPPDAVGRRTLVTYGAMPREISSARLIRLAARLNGATPSQEQHALAEWTLFCLAAHSTLPYEAVEFVKTSSSLPAAISEMQLSPIISIFTCLVDGGVPALLSSPLVQFEFDAKTKHGQRPRDCPRCISFPPKLVADFYDPHDDKDRPQPDRCASLTADAFLGAWDKTHFCVPSWMMTAIKVDTSNGQYEPRSLGTLLGSRMRKESRRVIHPSVRDNATVQCYHFSTSMIWDIINESSDLRTHFERTRMVFY